MSKLYIKTFGCQMNEYDSSRMADALKTSHGYERTDDAESADLVLLNTCSVREKAQEKVFSELGRLREWKAAKPGRMIGVGGCVASQEGEAIVRRAPAVDLVFGPQTLHRLPELIEQTRRTQRPAIDIRFPEIEKFDHLPEARADGPTAFVSIMEGCSKYCTFCIVPYTRGEEISRPLDDVIGEVAALVAQGVREVTLLGQNVNAYRGRMAAANTGPVDDAVDNAVDPAVDEPGGECDLALLILVLARLPALGRIRFMTSHPAEFTDALIEAFALEPKLAGFLHLPVQSGSDRILAMMKRGYTQAQYLEKIRSVRAARPGLALSSDFIVGFPSETDADFDATMALIEEARFDSAYSFLYSPRPGTPAANLKDGVPEAVKQRRLEHLQERIRRFGAEYAERLIGSRQRVLIQKPARKGGGLLAAKTECNRWVNFAPPAGADAASLIGRFAAVEITEALRNSLRGRLCDVEPPITLSVEAA